MPSTWAQLLHTVKRLNADQNAVQRCVVAQCRFTADASHVLFLGVTAANREHTLYSVRLRPGIDASHADWCRLLLDADTSANASLAREELLLRERQRVGIHGITSYELDAKAARVLFHAAGGLHICDVASNDALELNGFLLTIPTHCSGPRMDAKLCPTNSNVISFVHRGDLWAQRLDTFEEVRLTWTRTDDSEDIGRQSVFAGVAEYVMQEEFNRYTGNWWAPSGDANVHQLLYLEVDESDVPIYSIAHSSGTVEKSRYPHAGAPNAMSELKMVEFTWCPDTNKAIVGRRVLQHSLRALFPWHEYIVRCGWFQDSSRVWVQLLDRLQQRLCVVVIPVGQFVYEDTTVAKAVFDDIVVVVDEKVDAWINVTDILHVLHVDNGQELLLWASERTGTRQLYLVPLPDKTTLPGGLKYPVGCRTPVPEDHWISLTEGNGIIVENENVWVDTERCVVYFTCITGSPLEVHLYAAPYGHLIATGDRRISHSGPQQLTKSGSTYHSVAFSSDMSMCVMSYSSLHTLPVTAVFSIHVNGTNIRCTPYCNVLGACISPPSLPEPEIFSYTSSDGETMYGMLFKPDDCDANKRYPTVCYVYGGPCVQLVHNEYKGLRHMRLQMVASLGYVVVVVDGRGSPRRGLPFEAHIKNRLGMTEIADQVEGLEYIMQQFGLVDPERIALHGWSYGGYLALQGIWQRPDIFKLCIAGAPVTEWDHYDTAYTERYLGLPADNASAYASASVLNHIHHFPDTENRVLIVHGLLDDNVHFAHSSRLVDALTRACKPYALQVYPSERHGIRSMRALEHYETMFLSFLANHL